MTHVAHAYYTATLEETLSILGWALTILVEKHEDAGQACHLPSA